MVAKREGKQQIAAPGPAVVVAVAVEAVDVVGSGAKAEAGKAC